MDFYHILKMAHSGWRYLVLAMLAINVVVTLMGLAGKRNYTKTDNTLSLVLLIVTHLQLVFGLVLYGLWVTQQNVFADMANTMHTPILRYYAVEHIVGMLAAIVLVTMGHSLRKKAPTDQQKFRRAFIFFSLAFVIVVVMLGLMPPQ